MGNWLPFIIVISAIIIIIIIGRIYTDNPFEFPEHLLNIYIDVTGKREPDIKNCIEKYLIENQTREIDKKRELIQNWKECNKRKALEMFFSNHRMEQLKEVIGKYDLNRFNFILTREQTRYKQINYSKYSYQVTVEDKRISLYYSEILEMIDFLKSINYECTSSEYFSKNQRNLMTQQLKDEVKKRDKYMCQICGKYMPDGVGIHIDHIIPISKGGKSVLSNLQVLCSKCNLQKGNKILSTNKNSFKKFSNEDIIKEDNKNINIFCLIVINYYNKMFNYYNKMFGCFNEIYQCYAQQNKFIKKIKYLVADTKYYNDEEIEELENKFDDAFDRGNELENQIKNILNQIENIEVLINNYVEKCEYTIDNRDDLIELYDIFNEYTDKNIEYKNKVIEHFDKKSVYLDELIIEVEQ